MVVKYCNKKYCGDFFRLQDFRLPAPFVDPTEWMKLKPTIPSGQVSLNLNHPEADPTKS